MVRKDLRVDLLDFAAVSRGRSTHYQTVKRVTAGLQQKLRRALSIFTVGRETGPRAPLGRLQRSLEPWALGTPLQQG